MLPKSNIYIKTKDKVAVFAGLIHQVTLDTKFILIDELPFQKDNAYFVNEKIPCMQWSQHYVPWQLRSFRLLNNQPIKSFQEVIFHNSNSNSKPWVCYGMLEGGNVGRLEVNEEDHIHLPLNEELPFYLKPFKPIIEFFKSKLDKVEHFTGFFILFKFFYCYFLKTFLH